MVQASRSKEKSPGLKRRIVTYGKSLQVPLTLTPFNPTLQTISISFQVCDILTFLAFYFCSTKLLFIAVIEVVSFFFNISFVTLSFCSSQFTISSVFSHTHNFFLVLYFELLHILLHLQRENVSWVQLVADQLYHNFEFIHLVCTVKCCIAILLIISLYFSLVCQLLCLCNVPGQREEL